MLDLFRRKKSGLKWTLWLVIIVMSFGMVLLFVDTPGGITTSLSTRDVAVVAGESITATQFRRHYNRMVEIYQQAYAASQRDPNFFKQFNLGRQTLDQLISERVVWYEAQAMGIEVTPEEVSENIRNLPAFQENGRFIGVARYRQLLTANNLSAAEFHAEVRRDLARQKLLKVLTDGLHATEEQVRQAFVERNQGFKIRYAVIDPQTMRPQDVNDEDVRAFFEDNSDNYQIPEQRRVKYVEVAFDPEDTEITEDQIQNQMASMDEIESVRASHILIAIDEEKPEAEARAQAEGLLQAIRKGADFAELAEEHSTDTASAEKGGDLGYFGRGQMVPEFERAAFALEAGQLSSIVRSPFGFHIIKVTDVRKTDLRPTAIFGARQAETQRLGRNLAMKIIYEVQRSPDLETAAARYDKEVKETGFFGLGDPIEGLNVRTDFNQQIFTLTPGQVMEQPYLTGIISFVAQLEEIQPAAPAEFDAVQDQVVEAFKARRGEEASREKAFALFQSVRGGEDFQRAARGASLQLTTSDFLRTGSPVGELGQAAEILNRARNMKEGEISPPVTVAGKYVVFDLVERSEVDEEQFAKEKGALQEQLTTQKRNQFFTSWMQNAGERLRNEQQIEENSELVDLIVG